jgi:RNase P subunit RPR2
MAVKIADLEIPERGMELETRDKGRTELKAMKERIAVARAIKPVLHCSHCVQAFVDGRDAAVRVIEG